MNALTDYVTAIEPIRPDGRVRGAILGFRVSWRRKSSEEMDAVHDELLRHKVGRKARIKGTVERLEVDETISLLARTELKESNQEGGLQWGCNLTLRSLRLEHRSGCQAGARRWCQSRRRSTR